MPKTVAKKLIHPVSPPEDALPLVFPYLPLWQLNISEVTGHNIESQGREVVNKLLKSGWVLLHLYTLKYNEEGVWRQRPMAILGKPKTPAQDY